MDKTIIFDLGSMLVNLDWNKVCSRLQELSVLADVRPNVINGPIVRSAMLGLLTPRGYHEALCEQLVVNLVYEDFVDIWNDLLSANESIVPLVNQLKLGHRLVLASNTDAIHFKHSVENFDVVRQFDHYFLSYEMGLLKPAPAFFHHILRTLGTSAADCIFIDDRAENVESARSVGIMAFRFESTDQLRSDLRDAL